MSIFFKKPFEYLSIEESSANHETTPQTGLGRLTLYNVGTMLGVGLFSIFGYIIGNFTGPAFGISLLIALIPCIITGLCYAEIATVVPVSGNAYTYVYPIMGEVVAWGVGWLLIFEYLMAIITISGSFGLYLVELLHANHIQISPLYLQTPFEGGVFNLPSIFITILTSIYVFQGTRGFTASYPFIQWLKFILIAIICTVFILSFRAVHLTPFFPDRIAQTAIYGLPGILSGIPLAFYAFIGFQNVTLIGKRICNPRQTIVKSIVRSLLITTAIYLVFGFTLAGAIPYSDLKFTGMTAILQAFTLPKEISFISHFTIPIIACVLLCYIGSLILFILSLNLIVTSMSKDGLLPHFFTRKVQIYSSQIELTPMLLLILAAIAGCFPLLLSIRVTVICTLLISIVICVSVIVLRNQPESHSSGYRVPKVGLLPYIGAGMCIIIMLFLPPIVWLLLTMWLLLGVDLYVFYGIELSRFQRHFSDKSNHYLMNWIGIILSEISLFLAFWHQFDKGWEADKTLFVFGAVYAAVHLFFFAYRHKKGINYRMQ